ncbi:MAG TPA: ABC-F family ATP-binding cassette domain-containing protein [Candidatus Ozemobacteraceae bacterium]|nr:ABC-F family ATP-binding cassette domain-containing protein [Candidatus Ozemobacteraceae bacterium]
MNILSLEAIGKRYSAAPLLESVTFGLEHDERMGIIGRNGSGKTTLLRIIAGIEPPDQGRVVLANHRIIASVPQNPTFREGMSVLDAVFDQADERLLRLRAYHQACLALEQGSDHQEKLLARVTELGAELDLRGGWDLEACAKSILHQLGLEDLGKSVDTLSGGQRKRLALARALVIRPDLLILDEPTNHLDPDVITWLEEYLEYYSGALLLVTHDRYFLDRVVNRMLEIEKGRVQRFEANYTRYLEIKEQQSLQRESEAVKREGLIRRELAWLRQGAKARSTKQKAHVDRATALISAPRDRPERELEMSSASSRLGNKIIELTNLTKTYGNRTIIDRFSYRLKHGDRIGIIGPNGSGKTTLLEMVAGRLAPDAGQRDVGQTVVIGYYDQESRALENELRVIDYVRKTAEHVNTGEGGTVSAGQMLERFLFSPTQQSAYISTLSGGERRRLYLARLLMGAPNVLLLDEPTNDFDIVTLMALEAWLDVYSGCLLVASHDRYFLDRTVTQLFHIESGGHLRGYPGNYTTYLEMRRSVETTALETGATKSAKPSDSAATPATSAAPQKSRSQKRTFKEQREYEDLEKRIAAAESRKAQIENLLANPNGDFSALATLAQELHDLNGQIDREMNRWAELAEKE